MGSEINGVRNGPTGGGDRRGKKRGEQSNRATEVLHRPK
jgi:hypothetical protein